MVEGEFFFDIHHLHCDNFESCAFEAGEDFSCEVPLDAVWFDENKCSFEHMLVKSGSLIKVVVLKFFKSETNI